MTEYIWVCLMHPEKHGAYRERDCVLGRVTRKPHCPVCIAARLDGMMIPATHQQTYLLRAPPKKEARK